jgi:hypothetical protein
MMPVEGENSADSASIAGHNISVPHSAPHFLWALGVSQWTIQDKETLQLYDLVSKFGLLWTLLDVVFADSNRLSQ